MSSNKLQASIKDKFSPFIRNLWGEDGNSFLKVFPREILEEWNRIRSSDVKFLLSAELSLSSKATPLCTLVSQDLVYVSVGDSLCEWNLREGTQRWTKAPSSTFLLSAASVGDKYLVCGLSPCAFAVYDRTTLACVGAKGLNHPSLQTRMVGPDSLLVCNGSYLSVWSVPDLCELRTFPPSPVARSLLHFDAATQLMVLRLDTAPPTLIVQPLDGSPPLARMETQSQRLLPATLAHGFLGISTRPTTAFYRWDWPPSSVPPHELDSASPFYSFPAGIAHLSRDLLCVGTAVALKPPTHLSLHDVARQQQICTICVPDGWIADFAGLVGSRLFKLYNNRSNSTVWVLSASDME